VLAAFVTGMTLVFLRPPSFDGLPGLLGLLGGAVALVLVTAWATVALSGRGSVDEPEFESVVRRSEELAQRPERAAAATKFELLVAAAIDRLPPDFRDLLDDTPVIVSRDGAEAGLYGLYTGDTAARSDHPDRIVLYQDTLERDFGHDPEELTAQVERTLRHELAHHLGWDEHGVRGLGL
jgi:predicted Zn-dependent protease with MMP-like domain